MGKAGPIAPAADRLGRRKLILAALALMSAGMLASGLAQNVPQLFALHIVVGAGIGTVLAIKAAWPLKARLNNIATLRWRSTGWLSLCGRIHRADCSAIIAGLRMADDAVRRRAGALILLPIAWLILPRSSVPVARSAALMLFGFARSSRQITVPLQLR